MSNRRAAAIALVAFAATGVAATLVALSDHDTSKVATIALAAPLGLGFIGAGIFAGRRRPENRTGLLMIATGFAWFLGALPEANDPVLFSIGNIFGAVFFGFLIHLILAFPSGRLGSRGVRALAAGGYLLVATTNLVFAFVDDLQDACGGDCPENVLLISREPGLANAIRAITAVSAGLLAIGVVTVLTRRWRAATPALRRALTPVFTAGGVTLVLAAVLVVTQALDVAAADAVYWVLLVSLMAVPVAFLTGLLRARLATAAVGRLLAETPETPTQEEAQESLRRALRDPTLELAFWLPERRGYVDAQGRPFTVPENDARVSTPIALDDEPLALVVHDAALTEEPEVLTGVLAAAKLALQKDRLQAELRARVVELQRERDFVATVVNTATAFFCVLDADGRIERFNTTLERVSGRADDDTVRGRPFWEVFPVDGAAADVRAAIESRAEGELEHEWRSADAGSRIVGWHLTSLPDEKLLVSGVDVTERRRAELGLERHARFLSEVRDSTPALMIVADHSGRLGGDGLNRAVVESFGFASSEVAHQPFWEVFASAEGRSEAERIVRAAAEGAAPVERDTVWITKAGEPRDVAWSCTLMPDVTEGAPILLISGQDVTTRKAHERELRESRARIVEAGDAERKRLERNLHDGAQQRLVSLSLALRLAQNRLPDDVAAASEILSGASEELARALEDLRELARGLHPAILSDRGLVSALSALALRSTVPVELHVQTEERLPEGVEAALFYVAAEALTNVAKYADAAVAQVRLARVGGAAVIEIEDDGVGGADPKGGFGSGLRGLRDRVESLEGRLEVHSAPGLGTVVRAEVPVVREPAPVVTA